MVKPAVAALLAVAYLLFGLLTLAEFPLVWRDEAWYAQSAWAFADQGTFALPMFADLSGFDRDNVVYGRTYLAAVAAIFEVFGLSPYTARLISFVSGLVAITAVFGIGRELWNPKVGAIAAVFMAVTPNFVLQSHDARPEMMVVAFWTTAFYLVLSGDRLHSGWRLFLAGLIAALTADVHLNGAIVAPALFVVLLLRRSPPRGLVVFSLGAILGGLWWVFVHVLPDPALMREQSGTFGFGLPVSEVLTEPLKVILLEIARYVLVEPRMSVIILALAVIAAVVLLVKRRDRALITLLSFGLVFHVFMTLFSGTKVPFYAVLLLPLAALLVARLVDISPRPLAWGVSGLLVVTSLFSVGTIAIDQVPADYDAYIARLREHVPDGATIQGEPTIWYGFADHPLIATPYFLWAGPYEEEVRRLGIEYVIGDDLRPMPGCPECSEVPPEEMLRFLDEHAELVTEIEDEHYGRIETGDPGDVVTRIYRIATDRAALHLEELPADEVEAFLRNTRKSFASRLRPTAKRRRAAVHHSCLSDRPGRTIGPAGTTPIRSCSSRVVPVSLEDTQGSPSSVPRSVNEGPRHRRCRIHQRLSHPGAADCRPRGRGCRRLQQVRPGDPIV